jgi:mannose-6-phosphate isomerase-like protein (cupin superfamily)
MTDETNNVELTDEEAQERIANMFIALDSIYNLHKPNQAEEVWTCTECNGAEWPCNTEKIILETLNVA